MKMVNVDNIRTTKQVAKILRCTSRNVALMVKGDKLKPIKVLENGDFLFNVSEVRDYMLKSCKAVLS
jgi:hypothetical protein